MPQTPPNITLQQLKDFFEERPLLTPHGIGKAAGLAGSLLGMILRDERTLTDTTIEKVYPVLKKYGFKD